MEGEGATWKERRIGSEGAYHSHIGKKSHQQYKHIEEESRMAACLFPFREIGIGQIEYFILFSRFPVRPW